MPTPLHQRALAAEQERQEFQDREHAAMIAFRAITLRDLLLMRLDITTPEPLATPIYRQDGFEFTLGVKPADIGTDFDYWIEAAYIEVDGQDEFIYGKRRIDSPADLGGMVRRADPSWRKVYQ